MSGANNGAKMHSEDNEIDDITSAVDGIDDIDDVVDVSETHSEKLPKNRNWAATVLIYLCVFLFGFGFALWAGPRIAPLLPAGMEPVARWLSPASSQNSFEIENLRAEINARFDSLPKIISREEIEGLLSNDVKAVTEQLSSRVDEISSQLNLQNSAAIEARISALESGAAGVKAEMQTLMSELSNMSLEGGTLSEEAGAKIAAYAASLGGLKAQIDQLVEQNGLLSQKVDDLSKEASRQLIEAETIRDDAAELTTKTDNEIKILENLAAIDAALIDGSDYNAYVDDLQTIGIQVPAELAAKSEGVNTLLHLLDTFPDAAHAAIEADILAQESDGILSGIGNFLSAQIATRSLEPQEGNTADAILSRAEAALKSDDLTTALTELDTLSTAAKDVAEMRDWLEKAKARHDTVTAFVTLSNELSE